MRISPELIPSINSTNTDRAVNNVLVYMMKHYGVDNAYREIAPLTWYINTGRASLFFLRGIIIAKPFMIARKLHQGGSDQEIIDRIKDYLYETT